MADLTRLFPSPFVGRQREVATLTGCLEAAQHGEAQHDRARHATEQQGFFVLRQRVDQRIGAVDEGLGESERDDG